MDTLPNDVSDDFDLDALMLRVREAALGGGASAMAAPVPPTGDLNGLDFDLMRVIEAQGEWNEHSRKSLAALVESLRTLRDDWADAHARLCHEVERLSAAVAQMHPLNKKHARQKGTRKRVAVKRRQPGKRNGHRP